MVNWLRKAICASALLCCGAVGAQAADQCELQAYYGEKIINDSIWKVITDVSGSSVSTDGTPCGGNVLSMFNSLANESLDCSTANMIAGTQATNAVAIAETQARSFMDSMGGYGGRAGTLVDAMLKMSQSSGFGTTGATAFGSISECMTEPMNRVWGGPFAQWEKGKWDRGIAEYDYHTYGGQIGYDRIIGSNLAIGGSFSYYRGTYKDKSAFRHDSHMDNYAFGIYGVYSHASGVFSSLYAGYTHIDNDIRELRAGFANGTTAWDKADYKTKVWNVGTTVGKRFSFGCDGNFSLVPTVGLQFVHTDNADHTYFLGDTTVSRISDVDNWALYLPVEVTANYDAQLANGGSVRFSGTLGYTYNFNDSNSGGIITYNGLIGPDGPVIGSAVSRDVGRHTFKTGAGVEYRKGNFDAGIKYDYYHQSKWRAHRLSATVGFAF